MGAADLGSLGLEQLMVTLSTVTAAGAVAGILSLISLFFMYKGWTEMCYGLDELFCTVSRIIKYGTIASLALLLISVGMMYSSIQNTMKNPAGAFSTILAASPLLILSGLAGLAVFLSIVYAFYKLGAILEINNLKVGAALLLIGPLTSISNVIALSLGLTVLGLILLTITTNKLINTEIEVVEEGEIDEEYDEMVERGEPRPPIKARRSRRKPVYEEMEEPRRYEPMEEWMEAPAPPPKRKEVGAQLVGPNGFVAKLGPGIRTFGRRDFAGFVPDEDLDYISRRHFEIRVTSHGYFIRDLGSLNGTWVNGRK
ncbi:MAG: FHA domain-containing protein, partial [Candidatus Korarchaeota archaeon]|nr:FHA domain-containing protein [Candidatus Korarchaeota archaeon]